MSTLERIDPFSCLLPGKFVSFVGAGGKTSLAGYLGSAVLKTGKRAVMTTTTKIQAEDPYALFGDAGSRAPAGRLLKVGKSVEAGKLTGLSDDEVELLGAGYDVVLVEADGAKRQPLKYPASHEPRIPRASDLTVVVAGLDALFGTVEEKVFRWALFTAAAGLRPDSEVTPTVFLRLFEPDGLMKGVERGGCIVVLNKYDACLKKELVPGLATDVLERTHCRRVIVASVRQAAFYGLRDI